MCAILFHIYSSVVQPTPAILRTAGDVAILMELVTSSVRLSLDATRHIADSQVSTESIYIL